MLKNISWAKFWPNFWETYLPLGLLPVWYLIATFDPYTYVHYIEPELGVLEIGQGIILAVCLYFAIRFLRSVWDSGDLFLKFWAGAFVLGSIYLLGEELSWGQHFVGWQPQDWFLQHNDQLETNVHNTSSWLDQKPRILIEVWLLLAGFIYPLVVKVRGKCSLPNRLQQVMPTMRLFPVALAFVLSKLLDQMNHADFYPDFFESIRHSEVVETYIHWGLAIYAALLWERFRGEGKKQA